MSAVNVEVMEPAGGPYTTLRCPSTRRFAFYESHGGERVEVMSVIVQCGIVSPHYEYIDRLPHKARIGTAEFSWRTRDYMEDWYAGTKPRLPVTTEDQEDARRSTPPDGGPNADPDPTPTGVVGEGEHHS